MTEKPKQTRKPCPGCGADHLRETLLCRTCTELISTGRKAVEAGRRKADELGDAGFYALNFPSEGKAPVSDIRMGRMRWDEPAAVEVAEAIVALMKSLLPPCTHYPRRVSAQKRHWMPEGYRDIAQLNAIPMTHTISTEARLGTEEQRVACMRAWAALEAFGRRAYELGLEHGRNLLGQLAAGEITIEQLNDPEVLHR